MMLSHGYPPTLSGVTLVVQKLSRALVRRGHQVLVLTASEHGKPYAAEDEGVQLVRLRSFRNPFWSDGPVPWIGAAQLKTRIDDFRPDIIHTYENAILSCQLLRLHGTLSMPCITSCYSLPRFATHYLRWGSFLEAGLESFLWKQMVSNLNRYKYVIFSTRTQQQEFVEHGLTSSSTAISNGVDTRRYFPVNGQTETVESKYKLPPHPRILFVGRLMKDKRIDLLIQAMSEVCSQQDAHLLIVGRGDEWQNLTDLKQKLHLEKNVHLLGYVPEPDLPALYRSSDLFAIASICEVQSIPVLQAVATGLPVVAVDAAALPELVVPGQNGYLVPPGDPRALAQSILGLIDDPGYCAQLGRGSLALARDHSEENTFNRYEEIYREFISRARID